MNRPICKGILIAFAMMFTLSGCGKNEATKAMESAVDKLCQCKDMKCLLNESKEFSALGKKYKDAKIRKSHQEAIMKKMKGCMDKIKAGGKK